MKPYNQLTILANRYRARELRMFRELVELYFDRSERDPDDLPIDYEGARQARARINRMLPRVVVIVRAAGIGGSLAAADVVTGDHGVRLGRAEVLGRIFTATDAGIQQEILDVLDMALGVYDGQVIMALGRTVNPLHYVGWGLGLVARIPRRLLSSLGFGRGKRPSITASELARLEAVAEQLADVEGVIESRFVALQDRQGARNAEAARQVAELAERLDFAERILARRPPQERLGVPDDQGISTPV